REVHPAGYCVALSSRSADVVLREVQSRALESPGPSGRGFCFMLLDENLSRSYNGTLSKRSVAVV
ncbi:MAG: hypothetical protein J5I41_04815, partial [Saprospiraceae bacterium]|nr:hypothetical protein [Saprospiraceae bacterium]